MASDEPADPIEQFKADLRAQLLDPTGEQSDEQSIRSLDYLEKRLFAVWKGMQTTESPSDRVVALHNLARYTGWLLLTFRQGLEYPIEFYAWISRSIFELYLLILYVIQSEEHVRVFLDAAATDEIAMLEGILRLPPIVKDAHEKLKATVTRLLTARGERKVELPHYRELARMAGIEGEYDTFWKLYSKYLHPSSWMVNRDAPEVRNVAYQKIFLLQAQFNAHRILMLVTKEAGQAS